MLRSIAFITHDRQLIGKESKGFGKYGEYSATYVLARYNLGMEEMDESIDWRIVLMHIPLNVRATDTVPKVRSLCNDAG